jgi:hypothetical protein
MNWPSQSPDLNPIENLWNYIKDLISRRRHKVKNTKDIRFALMVIWPEIDRKFLLKLCDSVPRRWEACLKNGGGGGNEVLNSFIFSLFGKDFIKKNGVVIIYRNG